MGLLGLPIALTFRYPQIIGKVKSTCHFYLLSTELSSLTTPVTRILAARLKLVRLGSSGPMRLAAKNLPRNNGGGDTLETYKKGAYVRIVRCFLMQRRSGSRLAAESLPR